MRLEMLVMPTEADLKTIIPWLTDGSDGVTNKTPVQLSGDAYNENDNSASLTYLDSLSGTTARVMAHAKEISVSAPGGVVISEYPIRISLPSAFDFKTGHFDFTVTGSAIGFVPVVLSNLSSAKLPAGVGLWSKTSAGSTFALENDVTVARQVNYVRESDTFEIVFNIEIGDFGNVAETYFAFGTDPN